AGPGYGGSCLPKDVIALIRFSQEIGYEPYLLDAVHKINEYQPEEVVSMAKKMLGSLNNKTISILGLSFKKDTDDIRNAVSLKIIASLLKNGSKVKVHDPKALDNVKLVFGNNIEYCTTIRDCLENSDCCIIVVDWDEYKTLDTNYFSIMREKNVIDCWRILDANKLDNINYRAIGRN
ncbi:MAG: UDP binding domain-containing protein, partial [Candidatus Nitrosocaldaceae archaeon]